LFVLLAGYAESFMGTSIVEGFNVGYALALTQFLMVWVLGVAYLRYSERVLDPLRAEITRRWGGEDGEPGPEPDRGGRFTRGAGRQRAREVPR
jgi:hypothetical protein